MWEYAIPFVQSLISSNGADSAASKQAAATREAAGVQKYIFDEQKKLQKPFYDTGVQGNNRLAYLLGLGPQTQPTMTYDEARAKLLPQFTSTQTTSTPNQVVDEGQWGPFQTTTSKSIDEASLGKAIQDMLAQNTPAAPTDDEYGSLMRDFTMNDFTADPGYEFRLAEGQKALERSAAARAGLLSGAAMKAATRFGQDTASQEYDKAYGRFKGNQTDKYNKLIGVIGSGQGSANQLTGAAGTYGANTANLITANGNAQAASTIAGANAWGNAFKQAGDMYQTNQLWNKYLNGGTSNPVNYNYG